MLASAVAACSLAANAIAATRVPYLQVSTVRLSARAVSRLSHAFALPALRVGVDGVPRFFNADLYGELPMKGDAFNFAAIARVRVLSAGAAIARAQSGLKRAGLLPANSVFSVGHLRFGAANLLGKTVVSVPLDTEVTAKVVVGRLPLLGPGAETKIAFSGTTGQVSQLRYALPAVRAGTLDSIIAPTASDVLARQRLSPCATNSSALLGLHLRRQLAYYVPSPESGPVSQIFAHYIYDVSAVVAGRRLQVRRIAIPADLSHTPRVALLATSDGAVVHARATVRGGRGPYSYSWSSCSTTLDPKIAATGPSISYTVRPRGTSATRVETLTLVVTDANGLTAQVSRRVAVRSAAAASPSPSAQASAADPVVATEWIGSSQGLGGSAGNAGGFVTFSHLQGVPVAFNWGDDDVFEPDFTDSARVSGGDDSNWSDKVDMLFYTGHANRDGFATGRRVGDGFVDYTETRWGNNSPVHLKWLIVAACGPLQGIQTGDLLRWTDSFYGLHQLLGYATVTYDNQIEGSHLAAYSEGFKFFGFTLGAMKIRQAWAQTATDAQTASEIWGTMGLYGQGGASDYNDYFPGRGPVGPDIPRDHALGYWWEWNTA